MRKVQNILLSAAVIMAATLPAAAIEFRPAPVTMPADVAKLAGTHLGPDHQGFPGWTVTLGSFLTEMQAVETHRSDMTGEIVVLALWNLPKDPDQDMPSWVITDALAIGSLAEDEYVLSLCETEGFATNTTIAVGSGFDDEIVETISRAWRIDTWSGHILDQDVSAVTCYNEMGGD